MRQVLENYAKERNLDPFVPQTWYTVASDFTQEQVSLKKNNNNKKEKKKRKKLKIKRKRKNKNNKNNE